MPVNYPTHWALGGTAQDGGLEQNEQELAMLVDFIKKKKVKSFLEIGCARGDLQRYIKEIGVEYVFGITSDKRESHEGLAITYGKSQDEKIIEWVNAHRQSTINAYGISAYIFKDAKYDLIFVDGDHSYEPVKADYENYKGMCRYMAFHDILGLRDCEGVAQLWAELKAKHKTLEFIADDKRYASGIGVIIMNE